MRRPPAARRRAAAALLSTIGGAAAALPARLPAQGAPAAAVPNGGVAGVVTDAESRRGVAGAEVTVRAEGGDPAAPPAAVLRTGEGGGWSAPALPPGRYRVRVRRLGYAAAERGLAVEAADGGRLTVALVPVARALDAQVVTASRRVQRLKDAPVAVRLVGREEIARSGAADLAAVLTEQAGLQPDGGTPTGAGVMLQGLGAQRVLVLLDGQPLTGRINGNFDLSRISTANVRRVEIVQGPQSTLYGSDALGGVVNIITREPAPGWGASLSARGGSQGRRDLDGSLLGAAGPLRFTADVGRRDVATAPGLDGQLGTASGRWDAAARVRWQPTDALTVDASGTALDERQRYRGGPTWFFADRDQRTGRLAAAWARGRARVTPTLHVADFTQLFRRSLVSRPLGPLGDRDAQRVVVGELLASLPAGRATVDAGVAARHERAASTRVLGIDGAFDGVRTRDVVEPFAQVTLGGARWSVVPGARLTADRRWGTHLTPRVAAMLRPAERLTLRASAGRGFRAPDFKEQYLSFLHLGEGFGYFVRGNPDLRPELSDNLSGGVEWGGDRVYLRADAYANRFRDFVESRVAGDTAVSGSAAPVAYYTYANVGRGRTRGVDLDASARLGRVLAASLRLEGGYGLLSARDLDADRPLLGRARHTARAGLTADGPGALTVALTGVYTGRAPVTLGTDGEPAWRDGYLRLNARASRPLLRTRGGEWRAELGANNLLDRRPQFWPGFTGRQLYAGLAWRTGRAAKDGAEGL